MLSLLIQTRARRGHSWLIATLLHLGAAGAFGLAVLDSSPIPSFYGPDILTAILSASHRSLWYEYAASATAGSILGAALTFRLARKAGSAYLDQKFKKGRVKTFQRFFKRWGTGTLVASAAIPLPTPTSMFFAAAGASDYPKGKFFAVVAVSRAVRYFGIALIASHYGGHFLRILRHPLQHWGWLIGFLALTAVVIAGGFLLGKLDAAPAS